MKEIKELLFSLCERDAVGNVSSAADFAFEILKKYTQAKKADNLTVIGTLKGESEYTLMLDAHIDEVAFVVTDVDDEGFLTVAKCGGIDLRTLPAKRVTVHGREKVTGVFCSAPPHLSNGETEYSDISKLKIDTLLGGKAKEIISVGDFVTSDTSPASLLSDRVTSKAVDDRAGVVCLLELARRFSGKKLPITVKFAVCDAEELGTRGSKTAAFRINPDEAIAIDVSFGDGPNISEEECGKLSEGAMIGYSPALDGVISKKLTNIAKKNGIPAQSEIMGARTGTDADVISVTRQGVRTGLVSIPLRNMHTSAEVVDSRDIKAVCDLLEKYILSGGVMND